MINGRALTYVRNKLYYLPRILTIPTNLGHTGTCSYCKPLHTIQSFLVSLWY